MPTTRTRRRRTKSKLLNYLPKAAFQNPTFQNTSSGFSGPMVSIIPDEARRRPRGRGHEEEEEDTKEPTSPKVSCIGQIKLHKNKKKVIKKHDHEKGKREEHHDHKETKQKKQDSKTRKVFGFGFGSRNKKMTSGEGAGESGGSAHSEPAPSLGNMKRYSSGRQSLANFDWTAQIAPVCDLDDREFHSDEEFGRFSDSEEEDEVIVPFSAPMVMGGGLSEARKEVNLWQRRKTTSPTPLNLKTIKVRSD